jgi:hypothetical protein
MIRYSREGRYTTGHDKIKHEPVNAGIKSLRATLPDEIFTGDFVF